MNWRVDLGAENPIPRGSQKAIHLALSDYREEKGGQL
jgi:hypothetical protein